MGSWRSAAAPRRADAALALALLAVFEMPGFNPYRHSSGFWWAAVAVPGIGALAWRRVYPRTSWAVTTAAAAWLLAMRWGDDWGALSPLVLLPAPALALYAVAAHTTRRDGQLALLGSLIVLESALLWDTFRPEGLFVTGVLLVAAWAVGESTRSRREYLLALDAEQTERDRRAAAEERSRIARELHDVVAHHVSLLALQAGTVRMLAESGRPPDAALLAGLESASRQAMTELRQSLGVLRHSPDGPIPQPGMDRLPGLVERLGTVGLTVAVTGSLGAMPAALDLAAYRVVQEGLTNVLRHSTARRAQVTLQRDDDAITVCVLDDGPASAPRVDASDGVDGASGNGLVGLRERVAAHGGWLRAGSTAGGGFELRAYIPLRTPAIEVAAPNGTAAGDAA